MVQTLNLKYFSFQLTDVHRSAKILHSYDHVGRIFCPQVGLTIYYIPRIKQRITQIMIDKNLPIGLGVRTLLKTSLSNALLQHYRVDTCGK